MELNHLRWYLNDLSLQGQFETAAAFVEAIGALASLRGRLPALLPSFYCSRAVGERQATTDLTFRRAILSTAGRDAKAAILGWIGKQGPFLDDDRLEEGDDYFEFEGNDVTDQGLGEAARRVLVQQDAGVFSFSGGTINFERAPLRVQHGLKEEPIGHVEVDNVWSVADLEARFRAGSAEPRNWRELIETCREQFDQLTIPDAVLDRLNQETFYPSVANRTLVLLGILNRVMEGRAANGALNPDTRSLWLDYTNGENALFSDESDTNKRTFRKDMTFPDPDDATGKLFCPFHGKIKSQQFRIHFDWPPPDGHSRLKIVYIGPKITKH